jgi:hypothetical protein
MNFAAPARIALLATLVAAAACSSKDAASNSPAADAGATPTPAPDITAGAEPTANDISNYRLDMDKMRKYVAAIKGFSRLSASDSMAAEAMATDGNESTAQMIAKLNAHPVARRVLADAGLNAKDYVWITAAWLQAAMTEGILSSTPGAKMPEGQNMQNVDFMRQHKAELEAMMKDAGMKD